MLKKNSRISSFCFSYKRLVMFSVSAVIWLGAVSGVVASQQDAAAQPGKQIKKITLLLISHSLELDGNIKAALQAVELLRKNCPGDRYLETYSAELLIKLFNQNNTPALLQRAAKQLQRVYQAYPDSARICSALGECYLKSGKRAAALQYYSRAALLKPEQGALLKTINLAELLRRSKTALWAMHRYSDAGFRHPVISYRLGMYYLFRGEFEKAVIYLNRVSKGRRDNTAARARVARFVLYREMLNWKEAAAVVKEMAVMEPEDKGIWQRQAVVDFALDRSTSSRILSRAGDAESGATRLRQAILLFQSGRFNAAKKLFTDLAASEPDNYLALFGLSKLLKKKQRAPLYLQLAELALKNSRLKTAEQWLNRYQTGLSGKKMDKKFYELFGRLALEVLEHEPQNIDKTNTLRLLQRGLRRFNNSAWLQFYCGELQRQSGRKSGAMKLYNQAVQSDSRMLFEVLGIVRRLILKKDYRSAVGLTGLMLKSYHRHPMVLSLHSWLLYRRGARQQAIDKLERAVAGGVVDGDLFHLLGDLYLRSGSLLKAEKMIRRSLKQQPAEPRYLLSLSRVLYKKMKWDNIESNLITALLQPGSEKEQQSDILELLGDLKVKQGRPEVAAGFYRQAMLVGDNNQQLQKKIEKLKLSSN